MRSAFLLEYQVIRAGRWLLWLLGLLLRGLGLVAADAAAAAAAGARRSRAARARRAGRAGRWRRRGGAVRRGCVVLFRTALAQPYLLRVEADGEVLGYITGEQTLNNARLGRV